MQNRERQIIARYEIYSGTKYKNDSRVGLETSHPAIKKTPESVGAPPV